MIAVLDNRYRVVRTLGSGGFGDTFLAEDTKMPSGRRCVIKQLKLVTGQPQMYQLLQERFRREAAVLEALGEGHDQIPKLYAHFAEGDRFYLVQEWIDGQTLTEYVRDRGCLGEAETVALLRQILTVLVYVHGKGIIHRDIKPDNILRRSPHGTLVLIDFGAVKETLSSTVDQGTVKSSIVIGTPGFMPSEQATGRPMFASDLYSVGMTAIFMLTGRLPHELSTDPQSGEVRWQAPVSPALRAVVQQAVQFHPRDRFDSAQSMLRALAAAFSPMGEPVVLPKTEGTTVDRFLAPTVAIAGVQNPMPPLRPAGAPIGWFLLMVVVVGGGSYGFLRLFLGMAPPAILPSPSPTPVVTPGEQSLVILADSAFTTAAAAQKQVENLRRLGQQGAGYFPLSQYPNLGTRPLFQVYARTFETMTDCREALRVYTVPDAFCAIASTNANTPMQRIFAKELRPTPQPTLPDTRPSAEQAIREYYQLLGQQQYEQAWQRLSPEFQQGTAGGYDSFLAWWRLVRAVSVSAVRPVRQDQRQGVADVDLVYEMADGTYPETLRMTLTWSGESGRWLLESTERR
ncbi:MAG: serine/threonine protein kinase [Oscillatoriales cyanobacterium SM2_2_1]|nr:serine/threonine protein kinase [Oscillatoriales cyanobacterium SM2_2_1]